MVSPMVPVKGGVGKGSTVREVSAQPCVEASKAVAAMLQRPNLCIFSPSRLSAADHAETGAQMHSKAALCGVEG